MEASKAKKGFIKRKGNRGNVGKNNDSLILAEPNI